jgi:hypothetical protein
MAPLASFSTDIVAYSALFRCTTDINGPLDTNPALTFPFTGNGIPDGEFELGLLAAVLNNTRALDPAKTGGVTNAQILAAFQANFNFFKVKVTTAFGNAPLNPPPAAPTDMRSLTSSIMPWSPSAMATVLAGYATEGAPDSVAAAAAMLSLGFFAIQVQADEVAANTTGFSSILAPDGDADGDGFTNLQEYVHFQSQGAAVTIAAQLDPYTTPVSLPVKGTIVINGNRSATNTPLASLALTWAREEGSAVTRMRFSNDGAHWTAWESLKATRAYTLPGQDGYKTVRVQYLDKLNNRSAVFSDFIRLDTTSPTGSIVIDHADPVGDARFDLVRWAGDRRGADAVQR